MSKVDDFHQEQARKVTETKLKELAVVLNKKGNDVHPGFVWVIEFSDATVLVDKRLVEAVSEGKSIDHFDYKDVGNLDSLKCALNSVGIPSGVNNSVYVKDGAGTEYGRILEIRCENHCDLDDIIKNVEANYSVALKKEFSGPERKVVAPVGQVSSEKISFKGAKGLTSLAKKSR